MKRGFLDITKRLFRQNKKLLLERDTENELYWIYKLDGYKFSNVLREIENVDFKKSTTLSINTQRIKNTDFLIESTGTGILIKILKANINYEINELDRIEISAQLQKYA